MEKVCYIVGAAESDCSDIVKREGDLVIAADGGYDNLIKSGMEPDIVVGDMDSSRIDADTIRKRGIRVELHPRMKDDTDVGLAIKEAIGQGYKKIQLHGVLGGRLDHTLANIQLLVRLSKSGVDAKLVGNKQIVTAVTEGELELDATHKGIISVFAADSYCEGVSINGLLYELKDAMLSNIFPIGVSNEFIGEVSRIAVRKGTLIVVYDLMQNHKLVMD